MAPVAVPPVYPLPDSAPRASTRTQVVQALALGTPLTVVAQRVGQGLDRMVGEFGTLDLPGQAKPACKKGCSYCCYQRVELTLSEVLLIADYLGERSNQAGCHSLEAAAWALQGLDGATHHLRQIPCGFLSEDGDCAIYPVRPLGCRRAHSTDASICIEVHREPTRRILVPSAPSLAWNLSAVVIGYYEGLHLAGHAPHLYELNQALHQVSILRAQDAAATIPDDSLATAVTHRAEELPGILGRNG